MGGRRLEQFGPQGVVARHTSQKKRAQVGQRKIRVPGVEQKQPLQEVNTAVGSCGGGGGGGGEVGGEASLIVRPARIKYRTTPAIATGNATYQ